MDPSKLAEIQAHTRAIAALLYEETPPDKLVTLEGIEEAVRAHLLEHVSPEVALFLSKKAQKPLLDEPDTSTASWAN